MTKEELKEVLESCGVTDAPEGIEIYDRIKDLLGVDETDTATLGTTITYLQYMFNAIKLLNKEDLLGYITVLLDTVIPVMLIHDMKKGTNARRIFDSILKKHLNEIAATLGVDLETGKEILIH